MRFATYGLASVFALVAQAAFAQGMSGPPLAEATSTWEAPRQISGPSATTQPETQPRSIAPGANDVWTQPQGQPTGFRAGDFTFFPILTAGAYYDDNVFATTNNKKSDWALFARPELVIRSNWKQSVLEFQGFVERREYTKYSSENQWNGAARLAGTTYLDNDTRLRGTAEYIRAHEDRGVSEAALFAPLEPIAYDRTRLAGALDKRFGAWFTSVGVNSVWINYQDPIVPALGGTVPQNYRDGNVTTPSVRVGHVIAPLTSLFVEAAVNWRNFHVNDFDSHGYRVVGGVLFEPGTGARVKGEAYAGYMNQNYQGPSFLTVSTYTYGGSLAFLVTPNLTLTVAGSRDAAETALGCAFPGTFIGCGHSVVESVAGVRADLLVVANLVVSGGVSYVVDEFQGLPRTDRYWRPLASVRYAVNPSVTLGFDYRYLKYDISSTPALAGMTRNVFLFSVNGRL